MTEILAGTIVTFLDPYEVRIKSIGKPLPYIECKIVDPVTKEMLPVGEEGELLVRGYTVFKQYLDDEQKTKNSFNSTGWFQTGDIMYMDRNGYFYYKNRTKDIILYQSKQT
jgi:fatty-acyl-CoA synthase